jgi:hypothetical protein
MCYQYTGNGNEPGISKGSWIAIPLFAHLGPRNIRRPPWSKTSSNGSFKAAFGQSSLPIMHACMARAHANAACRHNHSRHAVAPAKHCFCLKFANWARGWGSNHNLKQLALLYGQGITCLGAWENQHKLQVCKYSTQIASVNLREGICVCTCPSKVRGRKRIIMILAWSVGMALFQQCNAVCKNCTSNAAQRRK